jgi:inward rectifier potassium channel
VGVDKEKMDKVQMGFIASLTGTDETFAQPIIARHAYSSEDLVYNKRFKDMILWHGTKVHIDLKSIHEVYDLQVAGT